MLAALAMTIALAPGAHVTIDQPASCYIGVTSVRARGVALHAKWREQGSLETWQARGGRVTFDGITLFNHSHQRVIAHASC